MENYIIIGITLIVLCLGLFYTVKHFKGESGCCGGGSYKPRKKRLKKILYQKIFTVDGMSCEHCKNRVEIAVNDIKGVTGKVNLKRGGVLVSYEEEVDETEIKARIERAGYTVTEIRNI